MSFSDLLREHTYDHDYRNLVIEGGGMLGIAYGGAIAELERRGILKGIKNYAGSSAGSIVAGALACGATAEFISHELNSVDFASFTDYGWMARGLYNCYYYMGLCFGDALEKWYSGVIERLTGDSAITLRGVHEKYGGRLVITATSMNTRRCLYMDYRTHPDMPLVTAVRASASIPGILTPVSYNNDLLTDGGSDNYPIRAFHRETKSADRINPHTLGLMLMTTQDASREYPPVTDIRSYLSSLLQCYITGTQKAFLDQQDWARTVKIPCGDISGFDFSLSAETRDRLVAIGRKAIEDHFAGRGIVSQRSYMCSLKTGHCIEDDEPRECGETAREKKSGGGAGA